MAQITKIAESKRNWRRRSVHLDGKFAFSCNLNVVARFRLREGLELTLEQVEEVLAGGVAQECFDYSMKRLQTRSMSEAQLRRKLKLREYPASAVEGTLEKLRRMNYLDDAAFARSAAQSARGRGHGARRALTALRAAGVSDENAKRAVAEAFPRDEEPGAALAQAEKIARRLQRLAPEVARRRLAGALARRGFGMDAVRAALAAVLGKPKETDE